MINSVVCGMAKLTMNRTGEFQIVATGQNHCGIAEKLKIKYAMVCDCLPTLDTRGFLFDQLNIDSYFQNLKRSKVSCEKLVMKCVADLHKLILKENPGCRITRIQLMLSPAPHAATMTYQIGEDGPSAGEIFPDDA